MGESAAAVIARAADSAVKSARVNSAPARALSAAAASTRAALSALRPDAGAVAAGAVGRALSALIAARLGPPVFFAPALAADLEGAGGVAALDSVLREFTAGRGRASALGELQRAAAAARRQAAGAGESAPAVARAVDIAAARCCTAGRIAAGGGADCAARASSFSGEVAALLRRAVRALQSAVAAVEGKADGGRTAAARARRASIAAGKAGRVEPGATAAARRMQRAAGALDCAASARAALGRGDMQRAGELSRAAIARAREVAGR